MHVVFFFAQVFNFLLGLVTVPLTRIDRPSQLTDHFRYYQSMFLSLFYFLVSSLKEIQIIYKLNLFRSKKLLSACRNSPLNRVLT